MSVTTTEANPFVDFGTRGRAAYLLFAGAFLAVVGVAGALRETDQFPGIFFGLVAYLTSLLLPAFLIREGAGWFHPVIFTSGFSMLQLVRRAGSYIDGMPEHAGIPGYSAGDLNALIWQLLFIQTAAQLAYYAGYLIGPKKISSARFETKGDPTMRLLLIIGAVGLFFALFLRNKGGLADHMLDLGKGRVRQIEENQIFGISVVIVNISMFMLLVLVGIANSPIHWVLVGAAAPAVLFMKYATAGSRSSMIFTMILCLIVHSVRWRRIRWSLYIAGAVTAIVAIGALGQVRRGTWKGAEGLEEALMSMTASDAFEGGLSELEQRGSALNPVYAIMARVPDEVPYLLGESYLTLLTAPIPRALWMDKPRTTGAMVGPVFFDSNGGSPPGPIGEAMWNFGIPGVIGVFFLFGIFHRWVMLTYMNNASNPVAMAIYAVTLLNLQPDVLLIVAWLQIVLVGYLICRGFGVVRRFKFHHAGVRTEQPQFAGQLH